MAGLKTGAPVEQHVRGAACGVKAAASRRTPNGPSRRDPKGLRTWGAAVLRPYEGKKPKSCWSEGGRSSRTARSRSCLRRKSGGPSKLPSKIGASRVNKPPHSK